MRKVHFIAPSAFPLALTAAGRSVAVLTIAVSLTGLILVFYLHEKRRAECIWAR
jgi:hypothetical protein